MPSTHKKVIVRKLDRDAVQGHVSPASFVTEGKLEFWWIYLAGAFMGAALAGLFYEKIR